MTERISITDLDHDEQNDLDALVMQWRAKRSRNNMRAAFYDMKNATRELMSRNVPATVRKRKFVLGWSAMAVDKLNRRANLEGFYDASGSNLNDFGMGEIMRTNRLVSEVSQAGVASLMQSSAFLFTTQGDTEAGEPEVLITAKSAADATGFWNARTKSLRTVLSLNAYDDRGEPTDMTMYRDGVNVMMTKIGGRWKVERRFHDYGVPVDPMRYRQRLDRPFGSSRISRAVMSLHVQALGTMVRGDTNGEAYSLPRYALLGATEEAFRNADGSPKPTWQAVWDSIWAIGDDMEAAKIAPALGRADIKQFHGQSPEPQSAHLRMLAQLFSGETSIPIGELGIIGDANPTSAEALQTSRDDLISEAESTTDGWDPDVSSAATRALRMLGRGDLPDDLDVRAQWRSPIHSSRAQAADAGSKIIDKAPWLAETDVGLELMGLTPEQITRAKAERKNAQGRSLIQQIAERGARVSPAE